MPQSESQSQSQQQLQTKQVVPKFIGRLFVTSLVVFVAAWLVPNLPWRPKRIEDYFHIYRMIFEAFRTYSMISTASSTGAILLYFLITGAYNWRRQYTQTTKTQTDDQQEDPPSINETLWTSIKASKRLAAAVPAEEAKAKPLQFCECKPFLESIKIFEYLDSEALETLLTGARFKSVQKDEKLSLKRTDMAFVTCGSFRNSVIMSKDNSSFDGLTVTRKSGQTLTSYSNVMRSLAKHYNGAAKVADERQESIKTVALEDSQVLILEEAAFVALARKSNLAAAHLTQVILSRFKRAAIPLIFDYFNLTGFASSFLGYFVKKCQGASDVKLTELLNAFQEERSVSDEDVKKHKVVLQYLIGAFELDHTAFLALEASPVLLQKHIQIYTESSEMSKNEGEILQVIGAESRGAFLILEGEMRVAFSEASDAKFMEASVGDFVGIISSLMGKCSSIQVKKSEKCSFVVISQHLLEMIAERDPKILFANIPDNRNTSIFIEFLDMCIDWRQLSCGSTLQPMRDGLVMKILHGRVRSDKQKDAHRELGSGSYLGERGIFKSVNQPALEESIYFAVRQAEIASFPVELIEGLVTRSEQVASSVLPKLLSKARASQSGESGVDPIKTICLLPLGIMGDRYNTQRTNQIRATAQVANYLERALKRHGDDFMVIDGDRAAELMGRQLFTTLGTLKMNEFLSSQEDVNRLIVYTADGIFSNWTRQCISQADLILLVAPIDDDEDDDEVIVLGDLEKQMLQMNPLANAEICFISRKRNLVKNSRKWLKNRPWIKAHYHLCLPSENQEITTNANDWRKFQDWREFLKLARKSRFNEEYHINQTQNGNNHFPNTGDRDEIEKFGYGRLVRRILGKSVGLVLGGGGARGLAHLGIYRALREAGIQVDLIGGTSIGAFIGGLISQEGGEYTGADISSINRDERKDKIEASDSPSSSSDANSNTATAANAIKTINSTLTNFNNGLYYNLLNLHLHHQYRRGKSRVFSSVEGFCRAMSSKWRQALDLTYPATSWFTGHAFNRALWKHFGSAGIEDFPIPFFAVTTDLKRSRLQIHRAGPAWKYIRASMSLSGFLPPVCDSRDGTLLVDGGYLANVPIELMLTGSLTELSGLCIKDRNANIKNNNDDEDLFDESVWKSAALSASLVIAVDVGRTSERAPVYYGDSLNGWSVLLRKIGEYVLGRNRFYDAAPLTLDEIQFRLVYASSAGLLSKTLKRSHAQIAQELDDQREQNNINNTDDDNNSNEAEHKKVPCVIINRQSSQTSSDYKSGNLPEIIYLRPNGVQKYATLEFQKYPEIIKLGYDYGKSLIDQWKKNGLLQEILEFQGQEIEETAVKEDLKASPRYRRSSI